VYNKQTIVFILQARNLVLLIIKYRFVKQYKMWEIFLRVIGNWSLNYIIKKIHKKNAVNGNFLNQSTDQDIFALTFLNDKRTSLRSSAESLFFEDKHNASEFFMSVLQYCSTCTSVNSTGTQCSINLIRERLSDVCSYIIYSSIFFFIWVISPFLSWSSCSLGVSKKWLIFISRKGKRLDKSKELSCRNRNKWWRSIILQEKRRNMFINNMYPSYKSGNRAKITERNTYSIENGRKPLAPH